MPAKFLDAFLGKSAKSDEDGAETSAEVPAAPPETARDVDLEMRVADALRLIYDPEIPVNIYDLGLIYDIIADADGNVRGVMTLTTPHCPVAESLPSEVEIKARDIDGVRDVTVEVVWDPPWDQTMMSEAARLELGFL